MKPQKKLEPKLRFPEFRGDEGWGEKKISDVLSPVIREVAKPNSRYLAVGIRSHGKGTFHKPDQDPDKNSMDRLFLVHRDDLIVNITFAWEGAIAIASDVDHCGYVSHRFPTYAFKSAISTPSFFRHVIASNAFAYRLTLISPGGAGRNRVMNKKDFLEIPVVIPYLTEQQKIADCLSSLDELIAAQARFVAALKTHKKGLMQQLFPLEGETQPRLRFPEFREAGEWEVKRLKQLATYTKGFAFKSQDYKEQGTRIIRVSDLGADYIKSDNEKIYIDTDSASTHARYKLRKGEIIITTVGSKPELVDSAVGRGIRVSKPDEGLLNQNLLKLEMLGDTDSRFLFCNINTPLYQKFIVSISRGNANQANIAVKELMDFELKAPLPAEQQRIADFLTSLDTLITAQAQALETLKTHKKGLMQQLFPAMDEVQA